MKFIRKWGLALVPGLALATPALALAPADQADLSQPGSVINRQARASRRATPAKVARRPASYPEGINQGGWGVRPAEIGPRWA